MSPPLSSLIKGVTRMPKDNDSAWLLDPHRRGLQNLDRMARYQTSEAVDLVIVGAGAGGSHWLSDWRGRVGGS